MTKQMLLDAINNNELDNITNIANNPAEMSENDRYDILIEVITENKIKAARILFNSDSFLQNISEFYKRNIFDIMMYQSIYSQDMLSIIMDSPEFIGDISSAKRVEIINKSLYYQNYLITKLIFDKFNSNANFDQQDVQSIFENCLIDCYFELAKYIYNDDQKFKSLDIYPQIEKNSIAGKSELTVRTAFNILHICSDKDLDIMVTCLKNSNKYANDLGFQSPEDEDITVENIKQKAQDFINHIKKFKDICEYIEMGKRLTDKESRKGWDFFNRSSKSPLEAFNDKEDRPGLPPELVMNIMTQIMPAKAQRWRANVQKLMEKKSVIYRFGQAIYSNNLEVIMEILSKEDGLDKITPDDKGLFLSYSTDETLLALLQSENFIQNAGKDHIRGVIGNIFHTGGEELFKEFFKNEYFADSRDIEISNFLDMLQFNPHRVKATEMMIENNCFADKDWYAYKLKVLFVAWEIYTKPNSSQQIRDDMVTISNKLIQSPEFINGMDKKFLLSRVISFNNKTLIKTLLNSDDFMKEVLQTATDKDSLVNTIANCNDKEIMNLTLKNFTNFDGLTLDTLNKLKEMYQDDQDSLASLNEEINNRESQKNRNKVTTIIGMVGIGIGGLLCISGFIALGSVTSFVFSAFMLPIILCSTGIGLFGIAAYTAFASERGAEQVTKHNKSTNLLENATYGLISPDKTPKLLANAKREAREEQEL